MWQWLANRVADLIEDGRDEEIDSLYEIIEELEARLQTLRTEIFEYVDGTLQPLNRRVTQRMRREEEKQLNTRETSKKGGLMTPAELRQYGAIK